MKNKILKILICFAILLSFVVGLFPVNAAFDHNNAQSVIDSIIDYKTDSSIQDWINGELSSKAGISSDWYVVGLSQYESGYNFSSYEKALKKYLAENEEYSASSRQKLALALMAAGSTDSYIYTTLNDSIGKLGVMSWIYGLHLLNNGYTSNDYTISEVKTKILSLQKEDGGWFITGKVSEVDATAMAVQALSLHYKNDTAVKIAVDKALVFLSSQQNSNGDFSNYGVPNPESAAQVLVALSSLGIDAKTDSRFIKSGNTLFDGINTYRLSDGSYCHKQGGTFSENATVQVFYSMVSYLRMQSGKTGLYLLDNAPSYVELQKAEPSKSDESVPTGTTQSGIPTTSGAENSSQAESETTSSNASQPVDNGNSEQSGDALQNTSDPSTETQESGNNTQKPTTEKGKGIGYKLWVSLAILCASGGVCVLLYFSKKGTTSNYLLVAIVGAMVIAIVLFTNFQSTDEYYSDAGKLKENAIGTVTISINCDEVSENGKILEDTKYQIESGDTVYDILLEATKDNKIHLDTGGENDTVYVKGLNNIYEFDFGEASGWKYSVNGEEPSESSGQYELSPNDIIEWYYSIE